VVDKSKIEIAIRSILEAIGEDPSREGLVGTPIRVARAYTEIFAGIEVDPQSILEITFNEEYTGLVTLGGISFFSMCEHHLLPFYGLVSIGYIPNGKIAGLSKFAKLVDALSKRLQVQERLTEQLVNSIDSVLSPKGVAVIISAEHMCMSIRGVRKAGSIVKTVASRGLLSTQNDRFKEFETIVSKEK
jgi:GTP cyclohydrolase I